MDRLTYDFQIGGSHCWQVKGADNLECREVCQRQKDRGCTDCPIAKAFDRLAAYEETGLEPGEIEQLKGEVFGLRLDKQELSALGPIDRLRELDQTDGDGLCGIPPVKLHQKIFRVFNGKVYEEIVCSATWEPFTPRPRWKVWVMGSGLPYYWGDVFGETVFLTRDAAEAALSERR